LIIIFCSEMNSASRLVLRHGYILKGGAALAGATLVSHNDRVFDGTAENNTRKMGSMPFDLCEETESDFRMAVLGLRSEINSDELDDHRTSAEDYGYEVVSKIEEHPPSEKELSGALNSIYSRPAILESILPPNIYEDDYKLNRLLDAVRAVIADKDFISSTKSKICGSSDSVDYKSDPGDSCGLLQWEALRQKYPCVICQDVLAGPSILNCSHSFCGQCVDDLITACMPADTDSAAHVIHQCPCCKVDIDCVTFERVLDEEILRLVGNVPDCEPKQLWQFRRSQYLDAKKTKTSMRPKSRAQVHAQDQEGEGGEEGDNDDGEEEEESWNALLRNWVPPLTFFVLVLIVACRSR
jgi:hypothetical protein